MSPHTLADYVPPPAPGYLRQGDLPPALPPYPQLFTDRHGYQGGLSILDALFCLGPGLIAYA